jgi:malate dehydrogenase (oxaloacetate-decarboxylating)(NADP+)
MKALRYHARRPTGNTQISATKPCDTVTAEMVCSMADRPLICALANPDPEVSYNVVERVRPDAIFASGRSDYPNQVNNVLAFPSIFRGALDVRATRIDEEMTLAACRAIAAVARGSTSFGRDCIMPMPLDTDVLPRVAAAVAGAAVRTGVASRPLTDLTAYSDSIATRVRLSHEERAHCAPAAPEARHG